MSKFSIMCLFLLFSVCILSNLPSVESEIGSDFKTAIVEHRNQKRIIGGGRRTKNNRSAVFRLELATGSCTGTFITPKAILTAAHCCANDQPSNITIYNNRGKSFNVTVRKYHVHPGYKAENFSNDLAIIKLTQKLEKIVPAKMDYSDVECGETVFMYGYGRTKFNQSAHPKKIRLKKLPVIVVDCSDDETIGSYSSKGAMCFGDSGGPMFKRNGILVGVHSNVGFFRNCSTNHLLSVVKLSFYRDFIQSVLPRGSNLDARTRRRIISSSGQLYLLQLYYKYFPNSTNV